MGQKPIRFIRKSGPLSCGNGGRAENHSGFIMNSAALPLWEWGVGATKTFGFIRKSAAPPLWEWGWAMAEHPCEMQNIMVMMCDFPMNNAVLLRFQHENLTNTVVFNEFTLKTKTNGF